MGNKCYVSPGQENANDTSGDSNSNKMNYSFINGFNFD